MILRSTLAVASLLCAGLVPGPGTAQIPEQFRDSVAVTVVELPVQVTVRNRPVTGLTAADFELFEDGQSRPIVGFEVITVAERRSDSNARASPSAIATATADDEPVRRRHLVVLVDLEAPVGHLLNALSGIRRMVRKQLAADDLAVIAIQTDGGALMLWGFSDQRRLLEMQLDMLEALLDAEPRRAGEILAAMEQLERSAPPNPFSVDQLRAFSAAIHRPATFEIFDFHDAAGAQLGVRAQSLIDDEPELDPTAARFTEVADPFYASALASEAQRHASMADLARLLRNIPEPKHLIFFSGRRAKDLVARGGTQLLGSLWELTKTLNSTGWVVQGVDVEGVPATTRSGAGVDIGPEEYSEGAVERVMGLGARQHPARTGFNAEILHALTADTGGQLFENYNSIGDATGKLLDRTAVTYLLAFEPGPGRPVGEFRKLEVEVRDLPQRAEVRHRPGYALAAPLDADVEAVPAPPRR